MPPLFLALLALLALLVIVGCRRAARRTVGDVWVTSRIDGERYRVHGGFRDPVDAADLLAQINGRIEELIQHVSLKYGNVPDGNERAAIVTRLRRRYAARRVAENSPNDPSGDTSYTLGKGDLIALCLRERDPADRGDPRTQDLHDHDTLTFVAIHELAHVGTDFVHHPLAFWSTFRFLLEEAEAAGVFYSADYRLQPVYYCGVTVDYNPRWDETVVPL